MTIYDLHLHWYPGYEVDRFGERLRAAASGDSALVGVIYDTEMCACWDDFQAAWQFLPLGNREVGDSRLSGNLEEGGARVVFFRGAQLVSEENVEMLVIGPQPDTGPLAVMVSQALEIGAAVLLPWGFGKWRGARGHLVRQELLNPRPGLYVSDSGNRPARGFGKSFLSGIFRDVSGGKRLDGSDPLPMSGDESFAFSLGMKGPDLADMPPDSLAFARELREITPTLESVGARRSSSEAIARQIRLRRKGFTLQQSRASIALGSSDASDIESSTDRYARRFSGSIGSFFLAKQAQLTLELANLPGHSTMEVLDIGGGHAQLAPHFQREGWSVSIFSSDELCRKRPDRLLGPGNYRFAFGDLLHLPYPDQSFEVVTVFRLVTHETDWESLIAEAARVARRRVIIDYPDLRSFNVFSRFLFLVKKAVEKDTRDYELFTRKKISAAMERAGLEDLQWRPQFFFPMAFYRLLGSGRLAANLEAVFRGLGLTALFGSPIIVSGSKKMKS